MPRFSGGLFLLALAPVVAFADDEASNRAFVATDKWGQCYARSVPSSLYGVDGETIVYAVDASGDREVARYPWFAPQLFISCWVSDGAGTIAPALVQFGPWPRGQEPDHETLALAIHYNGKERARYSTLDIAGDPRNASCSVSHYTVIRTAEGFSDDGAAFSATTIDGRRLTWSLTTGELVETSTADVSPKGECFR